MEGNRVQRRVYIPTLALDGVISLDLPPLAPTISMVSSLAGCVDIVYL